MWELPNPFLDREGKIVEKENWDEQKTYLKDILAEDFYGEMPPAPEHICAEKTFAKSLWDGKGTFEAYELSFGPDEMVHVKTAVIRPAEGRAWPIVFCGGYVDEEIAKTAVNEGFLIATPLTDEAAPDNPAYKEGTLAKAYPEYSFKVIAMWGWLLSRVADWLETTNFVVPDSLTVAGHSRNGKAAVCCAVYDERMKACAAGGSGCGGMGSLRLAGSRFGKDTGTVETLGSMVRDNFPHWYKDGLEAYGAQEPGGHLKENELRFDANFIGSVIAPRPLLILEGLDDTWANPYGTLAAWSAAAEVYHFLEADENCGIYFREGGHALNLADWKVFLAFFKEKLTGEKGEPQWHTRKPGEPAIGRSWRAPGKEEAPAPAYDMSPEALQRLKKNLESRWAFNEAGLETGMVRFMKQIIERAEAGE